MAWLLDTCVLTELVRPRPDPSVMAWLSARDEREMYLSVMSLADMTRILQRLPLSHPRRSGLENWLSGPLAQRFGQRLLPIDERVAAVWGRLGGRLEATGQPLPPVDGLIAATAIVHDLVVATGDDRRMPTEVSVENPWTD
ncbi:MAG: type II toxin-antitoxin system VapC family toxin [Alphaproteobacteria bacterium]|nr:type II toxin-antitoxin system VapC family toxin [Alphaproteobacteria bacterium]